MNRLIVTLFIIMKISTVIAAPGIFLKKETLRPSLLKEATQSNRSAKFSPKYGIVYYVLQFDGPVQENWKRELTTKGVEINSYIPHYAFITKIETAEAWKAVNSHQRVSAVVPYLPEYKMSNEFDFSKRSVRSLQIAVKLINADEQKLFLRVIENTRLNVRFLQIADRYLVLETNPETVTKLSTIEGVEWIEPYHQMELMNQKFTENTLGTGDYTDLTGLESGTKLMGFEAAWKNGFDGRGQVIGTADTGLDRGSLDSLLEDFKIQLIKGYALGIFAKSWEDPQGHGTHTAGSIVSSGINSHGIIKGGASGARLVTQGLWSPIANNITLPSSFDSMFGTVYKDDGVRIHSDSWGSPQNPGEYDNFSAMVDEASWKYPDLLLVFAAGNDGQDADGDGRIDEGSMLTPATAKNCLTVGASKNYVLNGGIQKQMKELRDGIKKWGAEPIGSSRLSDNAQGMAAFSSVGPTKDGRIKPEIVAPGTNILSDRSQFPGATALWGAYNQEYSWAGGTSMATPLTAGAAAVARQYLESVGFKNPSSAVLKAILIHSATDLFPGQFGFGKTQEMKITRPNVVEGFGRVDVAKATTVNPAEILDDSTGLATGDTKRFRLSALRGQAVRVTLVYTDAPASAGAKMALVNDLDLKLTGAEGVYYPNHLNTADAKNNSEIVEFKAPKDGNYEVEVSGRNVPQGKAGKQPYALIMTAENITN